MRRIRVKPRAAADLENIWSFGAKEWSIKQAESYLRGIEASISLLASSPGLGRVFAEFDPPVRSFPYRTHLIVYRAHPVFIEILRIRHQRSNWRKEPL